MIIKTNSAQKRQQTKTTFFKKGAALLIVALLILGVSLALSYIWGTLNKEEVNYTLLADAETREGDFFILNDQKVDGGPSQSKAAAYEGKYGIELSKSGLKYGFTTKLKDIHVGDKLSVKVWVRSPSKQIGRLAVTSVKGKSLYVQSEQFKFTDQWQQIEVLVDVTEPIKEHTVKIYCFNFNEEPVYFDNLSYSKKSSYDIAAVKAWEPEDIHLFVKEGEYKKLEKIRHEAIEKGLLISSDDSWVKGAIFPKEQKDAKINVKMRLKGDWTDHLMGKKWSFRVVTQADKSWNRLKTFSLQNPATRSFLFEWVLHEFFKYEDVLTTRYEFVNMKLNHKDLGLYVYEEHFLKQLPEFSKRKEGPIIRFLESGFWDAIQRQTALGADQDGSLIVGDPDIKPFSEKKTFNTPVLAEQYQIAQNLLYQYQYNLKELDEIFDIDLLAKYYAITDIASGYHGVAWHNKRYYYNPVTGKLEPIGYDGFSQDGLNHMAGKPFLGANLSSIKGHKEMYRKIFRNNNFVRKYHQYLEMFSDKAYLDKFIKSITTPLYSRLKVIQKEKPDYTFSINYLQKRALNILNGLYPNSISLQNKTVKPGLIAVCNRHQTPVEVVGTMNKSGGVITYFDTARVVYTTRFRDLPDYSERIAVPENAKFFVYRVLGLSKNFYIRINPWPIPEGLSPVQELKSTLQEKHPAYVYVKGHDHIIFNKNVVISEPIVIPAGFNVSFKPGTKIDIIKGAFVLCYSPVQFLGTEEAPILVQSSDKSARAFTVIKADKQSRVNYTSFSQLGAFSYKGWNLPGSVNFYESDVVIHHSTFTDNSCEDILNIVRSNFDFKYNTISNTFGDGFDADFCTGLVADCHFINSGNDAIDFSTSIVTIRDCKIKKAGDKGISMGEQGTAHVVNTTIEDAVIAIASKDLSKTTATNVTLKNCQIGFSAYQKKPEYGHGFIKVNSYKSENVEVLHRILPGSKLDLLGQEIIGD
ncbi:MAG: Unknown protein [uncultured Aureispira sp.]|uniref:Right handed beta helix domain-containing protein n=1 Tax=uncultured Aureispira sp. TaxID=1331704 RepID=A0A6S6SQT9_9BACT|nr:MAG: Unknown protein [uncultured Aureispira sp.]